jgi:hypothetical protein
MAFLGYSGRVTGLLQHPSVIYLHRGGGATWTLRKGRDRTDGHAESTAQSSGIDGTGPQSIKCAVAGGVDQHACLIGGAI